MGGWEVRHVAFVRNVMIGREGLHRVVLVELFRKAGACSPPFYISTGSITFAAPAGEVGSIVAEVEDGIATVIASSTAGQVTEVGLLRERSANALLLAAGPRSFE